MANKQPKDNLNYIQKAAVLLMSLETHSPGVAARIFSEIGEKRSKELIRAITDIGKVDYPVVNSILEEFYSLAIEQKMVFGGKNVSKKILEDSFGIQEQDEYFQDKSGVLSFLNRVPDDSLLNYFTNENDQLVAMCLSHMPDDDMARLMSRMSVDRSSRLSQAILNLEIPSYTLVWRFHHYLQEKLLGKKVDDKIKDQHQIFKLSRALEMMSQESRDKVMELLRQTDQAAVDKLERLIFSFEDLEQLDPIHIQNILYEIDPLRLLAVSMVKLSDSFKAIINDNVSDRVALMLQEEIDTLPDDISEDEIQGARNEIVQIARRLEREGKVDLSVPEHHTS